MINASDDLENGMFRRKVSQDGKYEIGIHPVLFGFRIRAGEVGSQVCMLDYCCVRDLTLLELTYSCVLAVMQMRIAENKPVFNEFPIPADKYYRDTVCISKLIKMVPAGNLPEYILIKNEELESYRSQFFSSLL